jgi:hypothetical protein
VQQKGFHRKLTAILSADVAGYSRLMQDDEAATVATLLRRRGEHRRAARIPGRPRRHLHLQDRLRPDREFFSDGITDEIFTALSKLSQIFVIARNSTLTYKGKSTTAGHISKALEVRYVLEASVRRDGDRVRVSVQRVDALTGHQLWAERR